ncbi:MULTISPECIES: DUF3156 family protein [Pseudomonas]|uniref:DUF3156 family protein n=1 Tax=Pseudomonas kribbensis TaxID=1628086 RepID=A0A4Y8VIA8_9PSED|nr:MULTISPECIES: DUF3156 family protein [Pseudomonas]TFH80168.1 DUF3156 family protein [Pseudomonas kribbensis]
MLLKLSEWFGAQRAPTGYRPGVTLEHLRRNLAQDSFEGVGAGRGQFRFRSDGPLIHVCEKTESQLLMHVVKTEFEFEVEALHQGAGCYELHHTGTISRTGIRCRRLNGSVDIGDALSRALIEKPALRATLMPLDFKRLTIRCAEGRWHVALEHMGGSEVVNRMPAFRRYIALSAEQKNHLMLSILALDEAIKGIGSKVA